LHEDERLHGMPLIAEPYLILAQNCYHNILPTVSAKCCDAAMEFASVRHSPDFLDTVEKI